MLERFFVVGAAPYPLLWQQHDPWLVLLSLAIDVGASMVALHMVGLARAARSARARQQALLSGVVALAAGIWAMHFVALLAFEPYAQGRFDPWITAASLLPSLMASWVALSLLAQPVINARMLILSAVLVALGIGSMHYIGIEAAAIAPILRYDPFWFVISLVVAVLLALLALWVRFGMQRYWPYGERAAIVLAGLVMGMSISGMHYTGMAAIRFVQPVASVPLAESLLQRNIVLLLAIATVTLASGLLAMAISIGIRYRQMLENARQSEARQRAVLDTAVDAVVMINGQGIIQSFNQSAERMFGWSAAEILGHNVNILMPEPYRSAHDGYLRRHLQTGHTSIIGIGREVEGVRKDGTRIPMRLAVGRVAQTEAGSEPLFVGFLIDLTDFKALERERRRGEGQLRSLISNLPGVAFRCHAGGDWPMVFVSEAVETLTGWRADELVHGQMHFGQLILAEDSARITPDISHAMLYSLPYQLEYRIRTRTGSIRWVAEYGRVLPKDQGDGYWRDGVMLDITEAKTRSAEFESTVAAINRSQAMAEFGLDGRILGVNENFLQLTGYSREELLGRLHRSLCSPEEADSDRYRQFWQRLAAGTFQAGEFERRAKDGHPLWIYATYNPILNASGSVDRIIKLATDLSTRRAMEQDLRRAKDSAEQAAAARASFLANMSHEIRTPMNAIIGFTEALLETRLDASQRRHLETVHHSAQSMLRLLNDILDTAKLEKGAVTLEIAPFNLRELCEQVLASLRINADKKGIALHLDYPATVAEFWQGDDFRIQQILLNLVGNAIKFTHEGQVLLRVSGHSGALSLVVEDTGIGMDESTLRRIFDPFAQADASTSRRYGGTGLGTTIAHQLAELMQGRIHLSSQLGVGSTFRVHLPLAEAGAGVALSQQGVIELPRLRILVVDDVAANLELLELILARQGHSVVRASSGEEAIDWCARESFDLVLMDLQMPGMDGLEATRRIRAVEVLNRQGASADDRPSQWRPLPIIALSANVLEQDQRAALAAGMNGFAGKPLEPPRLMAEMARVLGLGSSHAVVAPPSGALPARQHAPMLVIDSTRGLSLWQQATPWLAAIKQLLRESGQVLQEAQRLHAAQDAAGLQALAHRLKGAAASLALPGLQEVAANWEAAIKQQSGWASELMADFLSQLQQAYAALHLALEEQARQQQDETLSSSTGEPSASSGEAAPSAEPSSSQMSMDGGMLSAAQRVALQEACLNLEQALLIGELRGQPLAILEQYLPQQQLQALLMALDRFDFAEAQCQLHVLRETFHLKEHHESD